MDHPSPNHLELNTPMCGLWLTSPLFASRVPITPHHIPQAHSYTLDLDFTVVFEVSDMGPPETCGNPAWPHLPLSIHNGFPSWVYIQDGCSSPRSQTWVNPEGKFPCMITHSCTRWMCVNMQHGGSRCVCEPVRAFACVHSVSEQQ